MYLCFRLCHHATPTGAFTALRGSMVSYPAASACVDPRWRIGLVGSVSAVDQEASASPVVGRRRTKPNLWRTQLVSLHEVPCRIRADVAVRTKPISRIALLRDVLCPKERIARDLVAQSACLPVRMESGAEERGFEKSNSTKQSHGGGAGLLQSRSWQDLTGCRASLALLRERDLLAVTRIVPAAKWRQSSRLVA